MSSMLPHKHSKNKQLYLLTSFMRPFKNKFKIAIKMAAIIAVPKPSITKDESISPCELMSVIALITKRKKPSDRTVIGNVKTTKNGIIMIFKMDKIPLQNNDGPNYYS